MHLETRNSIGIDMLRMHANKNNILFVLLGSFSPVGGMYGYLQAWLEQVDNSACNVAVASSFSVCETLSDKFTTYPLNEANDKYNYKMLSISSITASSSIINFTQKIISAAKKHGADLVHFLDITLYSDFVIKEICLSELECTILCTLHDPKCHDESISFLAKVYRYKVYKNLFRMASSFSQFCLHVHALKLLEGLKVKADTKFVEIPHPVPKAKASRQRKQQSGSSFAGTFRIGFMGSIKPYKGLDDFLDALYWLSSKTNITAFSLEVVLVGKGPLDYDKWNKLPYNVSILNDYVNDTDFHQIMSDLDLLVLPYRDATQSGIAAMAVTYGIPTIATSVGALDQMIIDGENGLLVPPKSPFALGKCIMDILLDYNLYIQLLHGAKRLENELKLSSIDG